MLLLAYLLCFLWGIIDGIIKECRERREDRERQMVPMTLRERRALLELDDAPPDDPARRCGGWDRPAVRRLGSSRWHGR